MGSDRAGDGVRDAVAAVVRGVCSAGAGVVLHHQPPDVVEHARVDHTHVWGVHVWHRGDGADMLPPAGMGKGCGGRYLCSSRFHAFGGILVHLVGLEQLEPHRRHVPLAIYLRVLEALRLKEDERAAVGWQENPDAGTVTI